MSLRHGFWQWGLGVLLAVVCVLGVADSAWAATAYVVNEGGNTVTPIELATNNPGPEITVGSDPRAIAISSLGGLGLSVTNLSTAYVTNFLSGTVTPIEVATNEREPEIKVAPEPWGIAITPNGKFALVTANNYGHPPTGGIVTVINVPTNQIAGEINVGTRPVGIAITPNGTTAYVTEPRTDTVTPINLATFEAGPAIKVGMEPEGIAITPNGKTAYVTSAAWDGVTPINLATNTPSGEIGVGSPDLREIAITPNGKTAYITHLDSDKVTAFNIAANLPESGVITVGSAASGVAITPDGKTAYVTNAGGNTVTPIELATNTPGAEIKVGSGPSAIAITAAAHYFANGLGSNSQLLAGENVATVSWGTLALSNQETGAKITCHTVIGGVVENPAPAGPGVGETQTLDPYECEGEACTAASTGGLPGTYVSVFAEGSNAPFPETGSGTMTAPAVGTTEEPLVASGTNLKWKSRLVYEGANVRQESEKVKIDTICHVATGVSAKGEPEYERQTPEVFTGNDKPLAVLHCCRVLAPPELSFDAASGTLENEKGQKGEIEGTLKTLAYGGEELINARVE